MTFKVNDIIKCIDSKSTGSTHTHLTINHIYKVIRASTGGHFVRLNKSDYIYSSERFILATITWED